MSIWKSQQGSGSGGDTSYAPTDHTHTASSIEYDNSVSGMTANNLQSAVDEMSSVSAPTLTMTQAEYDAIIPEPNTIYVITA